MADDVELPATGAVVATDEVAGRHFQRMKLDVGGDGVSRAVTEDAGLPVSAVGELIEAIEAMRFAIVALTRSIGLQMPDAAGRQRVALETAVGVTIPAITTVSTVTGVTTVSTVTTVTSMTNQVNVGGFAANVHIPSLMQSAADSNRRGITVT